MPKPTTKLLQNKLTRFAFYDQFVLRTPYYQLELAEKVLSQDFLEFISQQKEFVEAIYISSPDLYENFSKLIKGENKDNDKIIHSLYNYWMRMHSRCTPFGIFSGCGIGNWSKNTQINSTEKLRYTRLDFEIIKEIAYNLSSLNALKYRIKFYSNNTIYPLGDNLRYYEISRKTNADLFQISSVESNKYLTELLKYCEQGASLPFLKDVLVKNGIEATDAENYIDELVKEQILISELIPNVTGEDCLEVIVNKLTSLNKNLKFNDIEQIISILNEIIKLLKVADDCFGNEIKLYKSIIEKVNTLTYTTKNKIYFQADLFLKKNEATLNYSIQDELIKVFDFLNKVNPIETNTNLNNFIKKYLERYGEAEMPLLTVLDSETGIGFNNEIDGDSNELLKDLSIPEKKNSGGNYKVSEVSEVVFSKILEAIKTGKQEIYLHDNDIADINHTTDILPPVTYALFSITNSRCDELCLNHFGVGIDIVSRFAHGHEQINDLVAEVGIREQEYYKDCILADIVFLPENRGGNVVKRPTIRQYEIPILSHSTLDAKHQILLRDIYVKINNGRIILNSKSLKKEIIPKLSTAHNYNATEMPVYQFLCEVQTQRYDKPLLRFDAHLFHSLFKFTPRVVYSNTILSKATWHFKRSDFKEILQLNLIDLYNCFKNWKLKHDLPDLFCLVEGDNEQLINTNDELSIRIFINTIRNRKAILLSEFLFDKEKSLTNHNVTSHLSEFIAFFKRQNLQTPSLNLFVNENELNYPKRKFIIGDDWIFYKFYCGIKTSDKLLVKIIVPLIEDLFNKKLIVGWFFIRYNDPEEHLRIRFRLKDKEKVGDLISKVNVSISGFVDSGLVNSVVIDTYVRELERYGSNIIELVEDFFQVDSYSTMKMITLFDNKIDEDFRWMYAVKCVDELLRLFEYALDQRIVFSKHVFDAFFEEHRGNKKFKIQLDSKYRVYKNKIQDVIHSDATFRCKNPEFIDLMNFRNRLVEPIIIEINNSLKTEGKLNHENLLSSLIHMIINKIFISSQRTNELVIYHFIHKFYVSEQARLSKSIKITD